MIKKQQMFNPLYSFYIQKIDFDIAGTPRSVAIDRTEMNIFIADLAHQAIICKTNDEGNEKIFPLFQDFEGFRLLGPNSLTISTRISK
jgi:hypothetical protein